MQRSICIISGKGGVGKTTSAINIAHSMGKRKNALLVDANITTPNVHVHLGMPILRKTLTQVLKDQSSIKEAIYTHESGLRILPTISEIDDLKQIKYDRLKETLRELKNEAEIVIIDGAAGLGKEALIAMEAADEILVVTNAELSAVLDAQKAIEVAHELGKTILGVVLNKKGESKKDMSVVQVERLLDLPVIGVIPYDKKAKSALEKNSPLTHSHPNSKAAKSYEELASLLLGEKYFAGEERQSNNLFSYMLSKLGLGRRPQAPPKPRG